MDFSEKTPFPKTPFSEPDIFQIPPIRVFLNLWFAKPMVWVRVAFHENDGNHEKDENDEDNSDSCKRGVECWIRGNHGNHENDENHENPGCKPRVPQTTGLEIPDQFSLIFKGVSALFRSSLHFFRCPHDAFSAPLARSAFGRSLGGLWRGEGVRLVQYLCKTHNLVLFKAQLTWRPSVKCRFGPLSAGFDLFYPAKSKRGRQEGDGTENVIKCRKLS